MIHRKMTVGTVVFNVINIAVFTAFTLLCIFPFYYIFINTISNNTAVSLGKVLFYPIGVHFNNYVEVLSLGGIGRAAFVSLARTVIGTLLTLLGSAFLGYAFSRAEYWRRKLWYRFVVIAMYFNAGLIPWFILVVRLGLYDTFLIYVLPSMIVPFNVILFKTFIEQIPPALEESAQIDGANYPVRFFRIILPLSLPIIATIAVFSSVGQWNAFMDTLLFIQTQSLRPLQYLLYEYLSRLDALANLMRTSAGRRQITNIEHIMTPTAIRMTISFIVVVPILFVYPFLQRFFVKGIMIGAIKG